MNDKVTLLATGILVVFFVITGLFGLLDNFLVMMLLFIGFIGIVVNILIIKSRKD
jgi:hypothetical protein